MCFTHAFQEISFHRDSENAFLYQLNSLAGISIANNDDNYEL